VAVRAAVPLERYYRSELTLYYCPFTELKQQVEVRIALNCGSTAGAVLPLSRAVLPLMMLWKAQAQRMESSKVRKKVGARKMCTR
jgi:hypothetical protein